MRTDIHRPSEINPADYHFIAFEHEPKTGEVLADAQIALMNRKIIRAHMERTGGTYSHHEHGGICGICGNANAIYTALFHHVPTNTYIRTGRECADKLDAGLDFDHYIRGVKHALEAKAGKRKAQASLEAAGLGAAWAIFEAPTPTTTRRDSGGEYQAPEFAESTISDIVGKLIKYGSISEKQTAFIGKLLAQIAERPARKAAFEAKAAAALPLPVSEDRIQITGKVVSIKEPQPYSYGGQVPMFEQTRMLVESDDGWKVFGTKPSALDIERGDRVTFIAKIKPSRNDPKFGFFSRPTKATKVEPSLPEVVLDVSSPNEIRYV